MIYYVNTADESDAGNSGVVSSSPHTFNGRTGDQYTIRIVALSAHLPSTVEQTTTIRGESSKLTATLPLIRTIVHTIGYSIYSTTNLIGTNNCIRFVA